MVNEKELNKPKKIKKLLKISIILLLIAFFIIAGFAIKSYSENKTNKNQVILENPMKKIVESYIEDGKADVQVVIQKGILEFNENYIDYIMLALGVGKLHKSSLGYGNPLIELWIDNEVWSSEIIEDSLLTKKQAIEDEDLKIILSKEETVKALLSPDITEFMKNSVSSGGTGIEIKAGKIELLSKGYLDMYTELTGNQLE